MYQRACQAVMESAMYSDTVVDAEREFCFFDNQDIAQPFNRKTYPETERRQLRQAA